MFAYNKRAVGDGYPQLSQLPRYSRLRLPDDEPVRSRLIVATEALAMGTVTRRDLMRSYSKIHRNVYSLKGVALTPLD